MTEFFVIIFYVLNTLIIGMYMFTTKKYTGELVNFDMTISDFELLGLLLITILFYFLIYIIYIATKNMKGLLLNIHFSIHTKKLDVFYLLLLIFQIIFFILTGVGRIGGSATSGISFVFSFLKVEPIFGLYYFLRREESKKIFWVNILLFSLLRLLKGWTGFILTIALYELYFHFKRNGNNRLTLINAIKTYTLPIILILSGSKIYQYMYTVKFKIRLNQIINLDYIDGMVNLINRLTFFPISVGAYSNFKLIKSLYISDSIIFKEIQGFFRPIAPRFIMPIKEFRSLNNNVLQSFWDTITPTTSSSMGLPVYALTLMRINFLEFIIWLIMTLLFINVIKRLFNSLEQYSGQLNYLYFWLLFDTFYSASLETSFSYGVLPIFYILPVLVVFKVIRIER